MYPSMLQPSGDWFADFSQLQDRLEELLGGRGHGSSIRAVSRSGAFPALNVGTWADALEIYAFAPGIDPGSIELTVEKSLLKISGERRPAPPRQGGEPKVYASERFAGAFHRVVALPEDADPGRVDASYANGVLKIVVGKRESAKPRQIQVNSGR